MLETEEASDSHDEEIRGPVSGPIGVYLATGLMDGIWNPLHWDGKQWAAAVLAGVIVLIGAWVWNRWKTKRG